MTATHLKPVLADWWTNDINESYGVSGSATVMFDEQLQYTTVDVLYLERRLVQRIKHKTVYYRALHQKCRQPYIITARAF